MAERGHRALLGAALTLAMAVSALVQFTFGALAPLLVEDLALSRVQLGMLSTAFFVVGAVVSPTVGHAVDALGGRRILLALFGSSMVIFALMAMAPTFWWLLAGAGVAGSVMAAGNPVTNTLVVAHVSPGRRGTIMGVKQSGVWVGAVLAGVALPPIGAAFGWRWAIASTSLLAATGLLLTFGVPRDARPRVPMRWRSTGRDDAIRWLVPYAFFMGAGGAAVTAYAALYGVEQLGMSRVAGGWALSVIGLSSVVARIWWARATERMTRVDTPLALVAGLAVIAQIALLLSAWGGAALFWGAMVLLGASAVAWNAVAMVAVIRTAAPESAGRASGAVLTGFYVGLVVSPVLFGLIVDVTSSYEAGWALAAGLFLAALLVARHANRCRPTPGSAQG